MTRLTSVALLFLAVAVSHASADLVVPHTLTGTYNKAGGFSNSPAHQNYRVGLSPITTTPEHRDFFIFDLTGYPVQPPGTVTGASIKLYMPKAGVGTPPDPGMGYVSPDPSETYTLTATAPPATLAAPSHSVPEAIGIFDSLGMGPLAGEVVVTTADMGTMVTIPLTPGAVSAINGLLGSGMISFGGRISTFDGTHIDELLFGFTDLEFPHMLGKMPTLVISTVPEPRSWLMFSVAACSGLTMRLRRTRARRFAI